MRQLKHISASSLILHAKNPRRWCLSYLEGMKEPKTKAALLGTEVHRYIESCLLGVPIQNLDSQSQQITDLYLHQYYREEPLYDLKGVEIPIETRLESSSLPIVGTIDLWKTHKETGQVIIEDHKTISSLMKEGKYLYGETEQTLGLNWQVCLYAWMAGGSENDIIVRHNQFRKAKNPDTEEDQLISFSQIERMLTKKEICAIINIIKAEIGQMMQTVHDYTEQGLVAIKATPENRRWYGRQDPWWPILSGQMTVEQFKNGGKQKEQWT